MRERLARQRAAAQDRLSIPVGGALRQQLHGAHNRDGERDKGQIDARLKGREIRPGGKLAPASSHGLNSGLRNGFGLTPLHARRFEVGDHSQGVEGGMQP